MWLTRRGSTTGSNRRLFLATKFLASGGRRAASNNFYERVMTRIKPDPVLRSTHQHSCDRGASMRKHSKVILAAEEQLVFGRSLAEMVDAGDNLRIAVPDCLLLELLDEKIARTRREKPPVIISPWAA